MEWFLGTCPPADPAGLIGAFLGNALVHSKAMASLMMAAARRAKAANYREREAWAQAAGAGEAQLPFVVEHGGALGDEARKFFKMVQAQVRNTLSPSEQERASSDVSKFCDYYHRSLSAATLKGVGHFVNTAAAALRGHN